MGIAFLLYVLLYPFPADIDATNYAGAVKNAYKFLGCALGLWVIYEVDNRFIKFDTKSRLLRKINISVFYNKRLFYVPYSQIGFVRIPRMLLNQKVRDTCIKLNA